MTKTPEPGIYYDVPAEEYHEWDAVSNSRLAYLIATSPKHYKWRLEHPEPDKDAWRKGRILHKLVLEPYDFERVYAVAPDVKRNTKAGKELWQKFTDTLEGRTPITSAEYDEASAMAKAIRALPKADLLLSGGRAEVSVVWDDPDTGVRMKARPDYINDNLIIDLKTTRSFADGAFSRRAYDYGYHRQAAIYIDGCRAAGLRIDAFVFVVVEKTDVHDVIAQPASENMIYVGRAQYKRALITYADCVAKDEWPGYDEQLENIELPYWVLREELGLEVTA